MQMEKIFSHTWRGRKGEQTKEELNNLTTRQTTPEEIQGQFVNDEQVHFLLLTRPIQYFND